MRSCRDTAELIASGRLTGMARFMTRLHLLMCRHCRGYAVQIQTIDSVGISARCTGLPYFPKLAIDLPDESLRPKVNTLFIQEMARRGIFCYTSFRPTLAHTEEDIRLTAEAAAESLEVVKLGLEGNLDDLLIAEVKKEPFRRLVR